MLEKLNFWSKKKEVEDATEIPILDKETLKKRRMEELESINDEYDKKMKEADLHLKFHNDDALLKEEQAKARLYRTRMETEIHEKYEPLLAKSKQKEEEDLAAQKAAIPAPPAEETKTTERKKKDWLKGVMISKLKALGVTSKEMNDKSFTEQMAMDIINGVKKEETLPQAEEVPAQNETINNETEETTPVEPAQEIEVTTSQENITAVESEDFPRENTNTSNPEILKSNIELSLAREAYFNLKNDKTKGGLTDEEYLNKLNEAEGIYRNAKNEIVKSFLSEGEEGKDKAREFLFTEVESKRKNDLENKLVGKGERFQAALSKGIEWWDNIGNEKGWKGDLKRMVKMTASLGLIGISSSLTVSGLANMGVGSATALSGGIGSYVGKKAGMGLVIGTAMGKIPEKHRKWVGAAMMAGSLGFAFSGGAVAGAGVLAASAFGLGLSKLTKKYDKKIKGRIEETKNSIDLNTIETSSKEIEAAMEEILKANEKTRIYGKLIEASVALAGSAAFLEVSGMTQDYKHQNEILEKQQEDLKHETSHIKDQVETKGEEIHKAETKNAEIIKAGEQLKDATVHKGEGFENPLIRQIEHNPGLAKELGFEGDPKDLHAFAQHKAHEIAIETKYVGSDGHEIRIAEADKIAYEIRVDHGHIIIDEKTVDGIHGTGTYEYADGKEHNLSHQPEHNVEQSSPQAHEQQTHVDTKTGEQPLLNTKDESMLVKENHTSTTGTTNIDGKNFTAENWMKAAENPYHLNLKDAIEVVKTHDTNISHLTHYGSLTEDQSAELASVIKNNQASNMMDMSKTDMAGDPSTPIYDYMHRLQEITHLSPVEETALNPEGETIDHYMHRAEMYAASIHKLDEIKLHEVTSPIHEIPQEHVTPHQEIKSEPAPVIEKHSEVENVKHERLEDQKLVAEPVGAEEKALAEINKLSRYVQAKKISVEDLSKHLEEIKGAPLSNSDQLAIKNIIATKHGDSQIIEGNLNKLRNSW